jgi:glycosyltransferase involved in cell wall biosynthesis
MTEALPYVVITPARNEALRIEQTIQAMLRQTAPPLRWTIVSDGSTDGTDEIVARYSAQTPWIHLVRMPERSERNFAGKAYAFNSVLASIQKLPFQAVACMDADVSFEPDYFAFLLLKLADDEKLGLVGTPYRESSGEVYDYRFVSRDNVPGICQLFRRSCMEEIGGYRLSKGGNIDTIACLSARMNGWKTRVFPQMTCIHLRTTGTAQRGVLSARFHEGMRDYLVGNHPLWQLLRTMYQGTLKPYVLRGSAIGLGYAWSALRRIERPVPDELIVFRRREQLHHIVYLMAKKFGQRQSEEDKL